MKDDQITLRLPRSLSRALQRRARQRGLPKSQLAREALEVYLAGGTTEEPSTAWQRVVPLVGSLSLDPAAVERDALARQLKAHNWRE